MAKKRENKRQLYNYDAEKALLCCVLIDEGKSVQSDAIFSAVKQSDFHSDANRTIYAIMQILYSKGHPVNFVTVVELLERGEQMREIGGIGYLSGLMNEVLSSCDYQIYLDIVKDNAKLRQLEETGEQVKHLAASGKNSEFVLGEAERMITEISMEAVKKDAQNICDTAKAEFVRIKDAMEGKYEPFGTPTGFELLDKVLWGMQKSDMITIAARPGAGKTAFAINVLNHVGITLKKPCLFFSLEMPENQIIRRMISLITGIDNYNIKSGKGLADKRELLNAAYLKLKEGALYVDDSADNTVPEMLAKAKRMKREKGLELVVIDYLQFVKPARRLKNRHEEVGEIARDIKNMARQLAVPVIALAQINRQFDKLEPDKKPQLCDLRESGDIENNSDLVMFLHPNKTADKESDTIKTMLIIGKFRNGAAKDIPFDYTGKYFKFTERDEAVKKPPKPKEPRQISVDTLEVVPPGESPFDDDTGLGY